MESVWKFFIAKRQFSYLLIIAALFFGTLAIIEIPKESAPEIRIPVGVVSVPFPGASAVDVERLVTNVIEDRLAGSLEELKTMTSTSAEGGASIVVEFNADADLDKSIADLKDEVEKIEPELPDDADDPVVSEINFVDQPVLTIAIGGDIPEIELQDIARSLSDELIAVSGVSRVSVGGERAREVRVIARQESLETFGISLTQISNAIRINNSSVPAGSIEVDGIEYTVQFEGNLSDPEEVGGIAITTRNSAPIYVRDVADVSIGFSKSSSLSRVSIDSAPSQPALSFDIFKRSGGNVAAVTHDVRERIEALHAEGELLEGLEVLVVFDTGEYLKRDLLQLTRTGLLTVLLVMITLFVSIGWRESLLAGIAVPFSFLISFVALNVSGNTINFISLFSLILSVGILVDSAIVIVEGIHTNMRKQMDKTEAALKAIREFHWPVTAGTMTTVAVFAPLFLISGITGEFIAGIPFTIIFVLLASLLVALGIVPLFASFFLRRRMMSRLEELQEKYTEQLRAWYRSKIGLILGNRKRENRFIWFIIGLFALSLSLPITGLVPVEFFPQEDIDFVFVELEEPLGTVLEETDLEIRKVEEIIYENANIASFVTTIGQTSPFTSTGAASGGNFANIFVNLKLDRDLTSTEIVEELRRDMTPIKTSKITVSQGNNGPPTGAPVIIKLTGDDLQTLDEAGVIVENILTDIPGTTNVKSSSRDNGLEFVLTLDRGKAGELGISPLDVASVVRTAIVGTEATTIKQNGEDIEVIVTANLNPTYEDPHETNQVTLETLRQIAIPAQNGSVLLGSITTNTLSEGRPSISHENRERIVTVSSELAEGGNTVAITNAFLKEMGTTELPQGVSLVIGGENEDAEQAFQDMFVALILGIILMLAVLVLQFNSYRYALYVLSIVPFSLIGIFIGLLVTGNALSFPSMMGFIALMGIVVNNSIILIDVINRVRQDNPTQDIHEVVLEASSSRLRPILLTTVTTVIGLIPLTFASELWSPIAIAIMSGLVFAVLITLVLVPVIYSRWPGKLPR